MGKSSERDALTDGVLPKLRTAIGTAGVSLSNNLHPVLANDRQTSAAEQAQSDYHINRSFSIFAFTSM